MASGNQPAPRGRLGAQLAAAQAARAEKFDGAEMQRFVCHVNASLDEAGEFRVDVAGSVEYLPGARVGATISGEEIPADLMKSLRAAMQAILKDTHTDLKAELDREAEAAFKTHPTKEALDDAARA